MKQKGELNVFIIWLQKILSDSYQLITKGLMQEGNNAKSVLKINPEKEVNSN